MMEQIYTVRVKCRPDPCLAFPSERAYSSSTVGGLAIAHLFLAALSFTLCSLGYASSMWRGEYFGGVMLVIGGLTAGVAGVLACKRWYVDRYIRWFLAAALLSCTAALLCAALTALVLLTPPAQDPTQPSWEDSTSPPTNSTILLEATAYNVTSLPEMVTASDDPQEQQETGEERGVVGEKEFRREIYIHLLLASLVEFIWSSLSVKIAWKGCKKSEEGRKAGEGGRGNPGQVPRGRPDILENLRKEAPGLGDPRFTNYSDVVKELCRLQEGGEHQRHNPGLPLPESHLEYRQRIEKFLAGNTNVS